ncbi:protein disulfide oxidoreductase [Rahnella sp. PAMC 25559]|uniref:protein disulfide oxidoreductase n=1 Tax=Rahnella sp. PAMC 25559 TaxID=3423225 RepID=UPI003D676A28
MTKLKRRLREGAVMALLILAVTSGMDFLRAPQAPANFGNQALQTLEGQRITLLEQSQQRPLLVYFWATWCGICKMTTPGVATLAQEGGNVITVALRSGDAAKIQQYLTAKHYVMPVVNDPRGEISSQWDVGVTPTFVIISKGEVVSSTTGWTSSWGLKARLWWAGL